MSILEIKNLRKSFGSTEVLKDINFTLEAGEVLSIIGSSGSGKTTLLRCLNFLETPDSGQIIVRGKTLFGDDNNAVKSDAEIRRNRQHFGLVFQSFNLFPQYTALKNVTLASELQAKELPDYKVNKKEILEKIRKNGETFSPLHLPRGSRRYGGLLLPFYGGGKVCRRYRFR